jgi:hypothetical protein
MGIKQISLFNKDPNNKMKDVSGVEKLNLLIANKGIDKGLDLSSLSF